MVDLKPHSDDALHAFAIEHVPYELTQLVGSAVLVTRRPDGVEKNALVESFVTHLRVIDDFLGAEHTELSPRRWDVLAVDFLPSWTPTRFLDPNVRRAANAQVAHLSIKRVSGHRWQLVLAENAIRAFGTFLDSLSVEEQRWADLMRPAWRAVARGLSD